jgi:U3 small nucleolar RNA-associated protein 22
VADVLRRAFADRAKVVSVHIGYDGTAYVDIGLIMGRANAARMVEHGPAADDIVAVKSFRQFWGSKSETRRFKDGRILESVVWEAEGPAERVRIFEQVARHVLNHHLGIAKGDMHFFASAYDPLLVEAPQLRKALYTADPAVTGFGAVMSAFDAFVKDLKGLQGLPLAINSVTPISEGLRYTSTFVPGSIRTAALPTLSLAGNYLPVQECVITFEGSGKWPEDLHAIQKVKAAFLTKIAEALRKAVAGVRCEVAFGLTGAKTGTQTYLDVLLSEGFAFRIWIHHARERNILEDTLLDESLDDDVRRQWQHALVEHHQQYIARPAHHAAIAALQSRHASFSTSVRITKRWLAAHLLSPHVATQLVELLCAKVYLETNGKFEAPNSGVVGFARTLSRLADWNWRESPLLIPVYTAPSHDAEAQSSLRFPEAKQKQAEALFRQHRKADPAVNRLAWYVATEQDVGARVWEPKVPSKMIAGRIQELARASLAVLAEQAVAGDSDVSVSCFMTSHMYLS